MIGEAFTVSSRQLASAFHAAGIWPSVGPLRTLADGDASRTGTPFARLNRENREVLAVLATPARVVTARTVVPGASGMAVTQLLAPTDTGPFVAVARHDDGWAFSVLGSADEASVIVAAHVGASGEDTPALGAARLDAGAWALLAALADHPEAPDVDALVGTFGDRPGPVVDLFRTIGPVDPVVPDEPGDAILVLGAAGVLFERDGSIIVTTTGAAVLQALREHSLGASLSVDHLAVGVTSREAALSFIRTPGRLFVAPWRAEHGRWETVLGEPGTDAAIGVIRALVAAPSSLGISAAG